MTRVFLYASTRSKLISRCSFLFPSVSVLSSLLWSRHLQQCETTNSTPSNTTRQVKLTCATLLHDSSALDGGSNPNIMVFFCCIVALSSWVPLRRPWIVKCGIPQELLSPRPRGNTFNWCVNECLYCCVKFPCQTDDGIMPVSWLIQTGRY